AGSGDAPAVPPDPRPGQRPRLMGRFGHMSTLEYRVLGPIEVRRDGEELPIDGAKQRTVLAALLLAGNHYLTDSTLSRYLWGEHPPATMNAQIYTYVSRLRKIL